jgi:hypothetical protein
MKKKRSKPREGDAAVRQPLQELRDALLDLHKVLIDSERAVYETNVGPIKSAHHFFQLVSSDPWFAWLRPVSQLIVAMDEALDAEEPLTSDSADMLMNESVFLLLPVSATWRHCNETPTWCSPMRKFPSESVQENRQRKNWGVSVEQLCRGCRRLASGIDPQSLMN